MKWIANVIILSLFVFGNCFAEENQRKIEVSGRAAIDDGQIVNGHYIGVQDPYRLWVHRGYINVHIQSTLGEKLKVIAEPEVKIWFNTYPSTMIVGGHVGTPFHQYSTVNIAEGQGIYSFFGNDDPALCFAAGVFPIKYNPDAANLGEYLFRTGTYTPYVLSAFEFQFARMTGFHLSSTLFGFLQQDLMLTTETQTMPLHDWSVSYLANANFKMMEFGAGISLHHWFSVDKKYTEPSDSRNSYFSSPGDTSQYTFKGIKFMGRMAFDFKRIMPRAVSEKFGKNDLRLYSEAAVLGVKNYPAYTPYDTQLVAGGPFVTIWKSDTANGFYDNLQERIPVMVGFNFPVCGLLDFLSCEVESYNWPWQNVFYEQRNDVFLPKPPVITDTILYSKTAYSYDTWKWSIKARKTFMDYFSITGQLSRDHMRHDVYQEGQRDPEEAVTLSNEWSWMVRLQCNF
jgi:hypothetical protein